MSKPKLDSGLEYFPLDVHFINDDKVQSLIYEIGYAKAISLIVTLYSMIYENNYYVQLDKTKYKILSVRLNIEIDQLKTIINSCCEYSIFNQNLYEKYGILTSKRIQLTYIKAAKRRKEIPIIEEYKLFEDHCLAEAEINSIRYISIHNSHHSGLDVNIKPTTAGKMLQNSHHSPQSKVKESKVKESKVKEKENYKKKNDYFLSDKNKITNNAKAPELNKFLMKYDINLGIEKVSLYLRLITPKQLLEFIAIDRDKEDLQSAISDRIKKSVSKYWFHFTKKYPKKDNILRAKELFSIYDEETQIKILDSIDNYDRSLDKVEFAKKPYDYLESEIWREYDF